jgi:hypothetical protein
MLYSKVADHGKRLDDVEPRIGKLEIESARNEGFRQGVMSNTK